MYERWKEYEIMNAKELIWRAAVIGFTFTFVTLGILQWDRKQRSEDHKYDLYLYLVSHSYHDTWHGRLIAILGWVPAAFCNCYFGWLTIKEVSRCISSSIHQNLN